MKPGFALSLSFSGIRLLHRAAGGWRVVGEVALAADDMAAELATLRKTAAAFDPGGLRTKVLLPNDQIKYLTIDTPDLDDAGRRAAAATALEGATPYEIGDLAFDISADGDKTHVAAVARETLEEAEAFAVEHRFHPVSFAAVPDDQAFLGEPFFGETTAASDLIGAEERVEPDGIAVVVIGDAKLPAGPVTETEKAATEAEEAETPAPLAELVEETEKAAPEPRAAPVVGFASRRVPDAARPLQLGGAQRSFAGASVSATPDPVSPGGPAPGTITDGHIDIEPDSSSLRADPLDDVPTAPRDGFLSRRKASPAAPAARRADAITVPPAPPPIAADEGTEQDRMTVFGARSQDVRGKPRFLGLILTAALLVFLAGVAAWASVFLDDGLNLSRLLGRAEPEVAREMSAAPEAPQVSIAVPDAPPEAPEADAIGAEILPAERVETNVTGETVPPDETEGVVTASLSPTLSEEDSAVLDALRAPQAATPPEPMTEAEIAARYAATGIWPLAPSGPPDPAPLIDLDNLYLTSIDPVSTASDAIALPDAAAFGTDGALTAVSSPVAAGTQFALNALGLVIPTPDGALSPDGHRVYLGAPPLVPPVTPTRFLAEPQDTAIRSALARLRPVPRPSDLIEQTERAQLDGLTRAELAGLRPALRPQSLQQEAEAAAASLVPLADTDSAVTAALAAPPDPFAGSTEFAAAASLRPDTRPRNFSRIVRRAERAAPRDEVRVASAAAVAPRAVQPKIPSKASVAKQATVRNALNLRKVNLIGVYGKPSNRRALVRLGNGRYKKVVVGDRIDGGRVAAIGESELRYIKGGRNLVLKMPR